MITNLLDVVKVDPGKYVIVREAVATAAVEASTKAASKPPPRQRTPSGRSGACWGRTRRRDGAQSDRLCRRRRAEDQRTHRRRKGAELDGRSASACGEVELDYARGFNPGACRGARRTERLPFRASFAMAAVTSAVIFARTRRSR